MLLEVFFEKIAGTKVIIIGGTAKELVELLSKISNIKGKIVKSHGFDVLCEVVSTALTISPATS